MYIKRALKAYKGGSRVYREEKLFQSCFKEIRVQMHARSLFLQSRMLGDNRHKQHLDLQIHLVNILFITAGFIPWFTEQEQARRVRSPPCLGFPHLRRESRFLQSEVCIFIYTRISLYVTMKTASSENVAVVRTADIL